MCIYIYINHETDVRKLIVFHCNYMQVQLLHISGLDFHFTNFSWPSGPSPCSKARRIYFVIYLVSCFSGSDEDWASPLFWLRWCVTCISQICEAYVGFLSKTCARFMSNLVSDLCDNNVRLMHMYEMSDSMQDEVYVNCLWYFLSGSSFLCRFFCQFKCQERAGKNHGHFFPICVTSFAKSQVIWNFGHAVVTRLSVYLSCSLAYIDINEVKTRVILCARSPCQYHLQ